MYDRNPEALRLTRPFALSAADVLDAVASSAERSARLLRARAGVSGGERSAAERPRDRLGPRASLPVRHSVPDAWRIK